MLQNVRIIFSGWSDFKFILYIFPSFPSVFDIKHLLLTFRIINLILF